MIDISLGEFLLCARLCVCVSLMIMTTLGSRHYLHCPCFTDEKAVQEGVSGLTKVTQSDVAYVAFDPRSL